MDLGCSARGYGQGDLATKVVLVATLDLTWQRDLATKVVLVTTLDLTAKIKPFESHRKVTPGELKCDCVSKKCLPQVSRY